MMKTNPHNAGVAALQIVNFWKKQNQDFALIVKNIRV